MTNNQKIELAQATKAQLVESCKHCLNCTAWVPELTDWDVMQSGYSDEQLYPELPEVKPRLVVFDLPALSGRTLARYVTAAEGASNV